MKRRTTFVCCAAALLTLAGSTAFGSHQAFPAKLNGRIVFNDQNGSLVLVNADGTGLVRLAYTNATDNTIGASWSPDGKLIAFSRSVRDPDIYVIAPDASGEREITFSRGIDADPTWSGDGSRLAFETNRNGNFDIYSVASDGSDAKQLTSSPQDELDPAWSADNGRIAFTVESADGSKRSIWVMNSDGSGQKQLTDAPNFSENPNWSPDGQWLAFDSDRAERGNFDVYKMRADGTGVVQLASSLGLDALPAFSPDGTKIVFVSDRAQKDSRKLYVMSADGGTATRLINQPHYAYQMVPDWQPLQSKDPCTIRGTIHGDSSVGSAAAEMICGLGGRDTLEGGRGHDTLLGGSGNDCLFAQDGGRDTVDGGPGRDNALVDPTLDKLVGVEKSYAKWPKKNNPCR
jgi:TolB protein